MAKRATSNDVGASNPTRAESDRAHVNGVPRTALAVKTNDKGQVFSHEAQKVGITATGEPDANELYPNERLPPGITADETCLELYRRFLKTPGAFALEARA